MNKDSNSLQLITTDKSQRTGPVGHVLDDLLGIGVCVDECVEGGEKLFIQEISASSERGEYRWCYPVVVAQRLQKHNQRR
jgi:hypothetical protein